MVRNGTRWNYDTQLSYSIAFRLVLCLHSTWLTQKWMETNMSNLNREFPSLLVYLSLNMPLTRLILNQYLQDRHNGLHLISWPRSVYIKYMKAKLDFFLRNLLLHRNSLHRSTLPALLLPALPGWRPTHGWRLAALTFRSTSNSTSGRYLL